MNTKSTINSKLIAPCGMNCGICIGHLRDKTKCLGCREMSEGKPESCRKCTIMHCKILKDKKMLFCSPKCENFPCQRLKNLDKRYKTKYKISMIENLSYIQDKGIRSFINSEKQRWIKDGEIFCIHNKNILI